MFNDKEETERPITVTKGTNKIIGVNKNINIEIKNALDTKLPKYEEIDFGMVKHLKEFMKIFMENNEY